MLQVSGSAFFVSWFHVVGADSAHSGVRARSRSPRTSPRYSCKDMCIFSVTSLSTMRQNTSRSSSARRISVIVAAVDLFSDGYLNLLRTIIFETLHGVPFSDEEMPTGSHLKQSLCSVKCLWSFCEEAELRDKKWSWDLDFNRILSLLQARWWYDGLSQAGLQVLLTMLCGKCWGKMPVAGRNHKVLKCWSVEDPNERW